MGQVLTPNQPAIDAFVKTDKLLYKPGDMMFIEVYLFDTFLKTPFTYEGRPFPLDAAYGSFYYPSSVYASLTILDPRDIQVFSTSSSSSNSTISFTYEIPEDQTGGEYKIVISGSYMPDTIQLFRIREFEVQPLIVQAELDKESYSPGETINGVLRVKTQDGSHFQQIPTYSYTVNFGGSGENSLSQGSGRFDTNGIANFSIPIPSGTNASLITIAFTVKYQ